MMFSSRLRTLLLLLPLAAPLLVALAGCGGSSPVESPEAGNMPGASYDAEIAKQKAEAAKSAPAK